MSSIDTPELMDESNTFPPTEIVTIQRKLFKAGLANVSTRTIVEEWKLTTTINYVVDRDLKLQLLHIAAWTGDVYTIQDLKRQNLADPAAQTEGGFTALHLAASRGHYEALNNLLGWPGLDAQVAVSVEGFTPLHLAAYSGFHKSVKLLLDVSDVNAKDKVFGRTALHYAAQRGHDNVVDLLTTVSHLDRRCKDEVRDLTPFLLAAMQPKGRCSATLIERLLDSLSDDEVTQINDEVGALPDRIATEVVKTFSSQAWRVLTEIEIDNSMKPTPSVQDPVDDKESDLYRKFAVPVEGHTALHLAATQDNHELVSHLIKVKGIQLNRGDKAYGMTPLHCAIRTRSIEAFRTLMSVDEVNASALLEKGGRCQRPSWLPSISEFGDTEESELEFLSNFERDDTPLHLAVRVCAADELAKMVKKFCNHPKFNPAIYNDKDELSLRLVWRRLSYCGRSPSILTVRRKVASSGKRALVEEYQYEAKRRLDHVLDLLESHPSNSFLMDFVNERRKAAQDSVNAFLVTATLVAGLSFSAYLQSPFGTDEYRSRPAKLFWTSNGLSFYFAVYTILRCLISIMRSDRRIDNRFHRSVYVVVIRIQTAVPLTLSIAFAIGAFVAAGYGQLPPESRSLMLACTIVGLLMVLFQLIRNLYVAFSVLIHGDVSLSRHREEKVTLEAYLDVVTDMFGGPFLIPVSYYRRLKKAGLNSRKISPLKLDSVQNTWNLGFIGIQIYGATFVVLYAVFDAS